MGLKLKNSYDRQAAEGLFVFIKTDLTFQKQVCFNFPRKIYN